MGLLISGEKAHSSVVRMNYSNVLNMNNLTTGEHVEKFANVTEPYPLPTNTTADKNIPPLSRDFVAQELVLGISLSILDGLACTGNSILTKKLQTEIKNIFILAVYYNITSITLSLIIMLATELPDLFFPTDAKNIIYFTIHSTSKLISSFTMQMALYFGSAVTCALTFNANLPLNALCEYVLFRSMQPLSGGNSTELTGVIIVTFGVILCPFVDLIKYFHTNRCDVKNEQKRLLKE